MGTYSSFCALYFYSSHPIQSSTASSIASADTTANMGNQLSQMFPPAAKFTEKELPDQTGKVFIVTGASSGVGKELAQILYSHNAKVYVAARSSERPQKLSNPSRPHFLILKAQSNSSISTSTIYPQSKHLQKSFCPKRRSSTCYGIMQV